MLDFAFDAPVVLTANGQKNTMSLSVALVYVNTLLAQGAVLRLDTPEKTPYLIYDGAHVYADNRILKTLIEMGGHFVQPEQEGGE